MCLTCNSSVSVLLRFRVLKCVVSNCLDGRTSHQTCLTKLPWIYHLLFLLFPANIFLVWIFLFDIISFDLEYRTSHLFHDYTVLSILFTISIGYKTQTSSLNLQDLLSIIIVHLFSLGIRLSISNLTFLADAIYAGDIADEVQTHRSHQHPPFTTISSNFQQNASLVHIT